MEACCERRSGDELNDDIIPGESRARSPGSEEILRRLLGDMARCGVPGLIDDGNPPPTATAGTTGGVIIVRSAFFNVPWLDLAKVSAAVVGESGSLCESEPGGGVSGPPQ